MQKLAKREEEIMQAIWKLEKAFVKDIIAELPDPKPHYNSVATMVKILESKGYIDHETFGNTFRYFALVPQIEYQSQEVDNIVKKYFNNSVSSMVAFFARKENVSKEELEEIVKIIKEKQA